MLEQVNRYDSSGSCNRISLSRHSSATKRRYQEKESLIIDLRLSSQGDSAEACSNRPDLLLSKTAAQQFVQRNFN